MAALAARPSKCLACFRVSASKTCGRSSQWPFHRHRGGHSCGLAVCFGLSVRPLQLEPLLLLFLLGRSIGSCAPLQPAATFFPFAPYPSTPCPPPWYLERPQTQMPKQEVLPEKDADASAGGLWTFLVRSTLPAESMKCHAFPPLPCPNHSLPAESMKLHAFKQQVGSSKY